MTLAQCHDTLIELLADQENRVIAVSGKWGTGKSYLWRSQVQENSNDKTIKDAVYTSLFGVSSIPEFKLKIAQSSMTSLQPGSPVAEAVRTGYAGLKKVLQKLHSGFSALDEVALLMAPMAIKGRLIVIDDIERKHAKLTIDEVLGFIDDCVQNLGCRILLILNSDQLADIALWDVFREKVIDQELRLDTSPAEAFDIAARLTETAYAAAIKSAIEICRITNIRIIRKIIRVVNRLLDGRQALPEQVLARSVPSVTLLGAIHYRGLEDGPDFDFVLKFEESLIASLQERDARGRDAEVPPESKNRERWLLLLDALGIRGTDEFEQLVVDHLRSGLVDGAKVGRVIDRYVAEGHELAVRTRAQDFFHRCAWHPEFSEAQLLDELKTFVVDVGAMDMYLVTSLHDRAVGIAGGDAVARELIDGWLAAFRQRHAAGEDAEFDSDVNYFRRPLHPDIAAEIRAVQARHQSTATLVEVCRKINRDHGWGDREMTFLRSVTPADYEAAIRAATGSDLKVLLLQGIDFVKNKAMYSVPFGRAPECFLDACRAIVRDAPDGRLAGLVRSVFQGAEESLEPAAEEGVESPRGEAR